MRRKLLMTVIVSVLVVTLPARGVRAEPKADPRYIPHEITPEDPAWSANFGTSSFDDLWVDVDLEPWDKVTELEQTALFNWTPNVPYRGPLSIGFDFHFMQGPAKGFPVWKWLGGPEVQQRFPVFSGEFKYELTNAGYDQLWVSRKGMVLFGSESDPLHPGSWIPPTSSWSAPWGAMDLNVTPPNNYIAPFWNTLTIGSNDYWQFTRTKLTKVERPRGRMLCTTKGKAPNRVFVLEWLNARNEHTGFLCTFELQLFETSNSILFLYKDFAAKGPESTWFSVTPVTIGMEGFYGQATVGDHYGLPGTEKWWGVEYDYLPSPVAPRSMRGFVY